MKLIALLLLSTCVALAQKQKPPEVQLLEAAARHEEDRLTIDGRLKNVGEKPIRKLTVIYDVLDPDANLLTQQRGVIEEPVLERGQEIGFHAQIRFHARSVQVRLVFEDGGGRELRTNPTKPLQIE